MATVEIPLDLALLALVAAYAIVRLRVERNREQKEPTVDHVTVYPESRDWREEALKRAAEKYGRPFRCAGNGVPREVLRPHTSLNHQVFVVEQ